MTAAGRFLSRAHNLLGCALLQSPACNPMLHHPDADHEILIKRVDLSLAWLSHLFTAALWAA